MKKAVSCQLTADSQKIQKSFSRAAPRYEELATLQQAIGLRFLAQLQGENPRNILDIGMGTGWLTDNLCLRFPKATIVGVDFADGMVEYARKKKSHFRIVQADACALPFQENCFDMVASNLVYQWVGRFSEAFAAVFHVLQKGGVFYLSSFGPLTLRELFFSIEKSTNGRKISFADTKLPGKKYVTNALLESGFCDFHVRSEIFKVYFADVSSLLHWLKDIGANSIGHDIFLGKELLFRTNEFYKKNFSGEKGIRASFEVVWAKAKK